jgi:hypothetical protein
MYGFVRALLAAYTSVMRCFVLWIISSSQIDWVVFQSFSHFLDSAIGIGFGICDGLQNDFNTKTQKHKNTPDWYEGK